MIAETTPISIEFPNWFYVVFSVGVLAFIFFAGFNYCKIKEVCKEFPKIRRALDIISQLLLTHKWVAEPVYVSVTSPLGLTPSGKQMLKESGFEEFYEANKKAFFNYIADQNPKTESEVEAAARNLMLYLDTTKTPKIELVENFSYKFGRTIPDILFAYSIEIRDRYLKENPIKPPK